ncbi:MAG: peptidoglycan-associated lipoprotein [Micavibrio sp.]|nr:peptidoglycan-associated lipoprotein [Micavibrio sp.]
MLVRVLFMMLLSVSVVACSSSNKDLGDSEGAVLGGGNVYDGAEGTEIYDGSSVAGVDGSTIPGSQEDFIVNAGERVLFDTDSHNVNGDARMTLDAQARWLNTYPGLNITIEGHADERGTREYNLALGERRANSVKNYLISMGVDPRRLTTISYGKEQPEAVGNDPSAWAQNRRGITRIQ